MPEDPKKLVEAAKNGNKEAFGEIYRLYVARIYRFIYYLVTDEPLAEDLTQETFVKAWKALPHFSAKKGSLQAYLFAIARNLVIDRQRKRKEIALSDEAAAILESDENVEENAIIKEDERLVKEALDILEPDERQIVILRYFEDLHFEEISKVVGKKEGALRVEVHRLLSKLRLYIEEKQK